MKKKHVELTAENIGKALKAGATSLTQVWRVLGGAGNVAGSTAVKMRTLVPSIDDIMAQNRATKGGADSTAPRATDKRAASGGPSAPSRHPANPYRAGSLYGTLVDCMAQPEALKNGISREKLTATVAAILNRDPRLVAYGITVVCSPKDSSPTCERHRSCREGYGVQKSDGGWVKLVLPPSKS